MNNALIHKLAVTSMKKNNKSLIPFLIAGAVTVMVYYILTSLVYGPYIYYKGEEMFYGGYMISTLLSIGSFIVAIFAVIVILYANQFVMKERRKEIGLYAILGLSKANIICLLLEEMLIKIVICIGSGILVGTFLNKIMLLLLFKIIHQPPVDGFWFSSEALIMTLIIFCGVFTICFLVNVFSINVGTPIELLRSSKVGEKEPRIKWLTLVIGIGALVLGYGIALSCKTAGEALANIFGSIILVIIGTYGLFIAGSIFILKTLKKNKRFYYKTRNFISVSSLLYRMKHNAAGLASICVLSTAVILLITCATTLVALGKKNIDEMYPKDVKILGTVTKEMKEEQTGYADWVLSAINKVSQDCGIKAIDPVAYECKKSRWKRVENGFVFMKKESGYDFDTQTMVYMLTLDEYRQYIDEKIELSDNEILFADTLKLHFKTMIINGKEYQVKGRTNIKALECLTDSSMVLFDNAYIVVKDQKAMNALVEGDEMAGNPEVKDIIAGFDLERKLTVQEMELISKNFDAQFENIESYFKQEDEKLFVTMYGGVFFVGVFLAIIFLFATVMIIYYKQMSEGYEDQNNYRILQNVGLTQKEIKATIKRQVMILFFLPVLTAILHMIVASKIVRLFFKMILIIDSFTFNMSILGVVLVFLVVYWIVYKITSMEYYTIVNRNQYAEGGTSFS